MARQAYWKTAAAQYVMQVAGLKDIDRAIGKIAADLMKGLAVPPTDLEELAPRVAIADIRRDNTMLVPGEIRKLPEGLVVFLLPNLSKTRRRFTIAHEFGHAFFEMSGRRPHPSRELERLCDKFAAEFLMPRRDFVAHAGSRPDLSRVHELCQRFETGLQATLIRVSDIYHYRAIELMNGRVVWRRRFSLPSLYEVRDRMMVLCGKKGSELIDLYDRGGYSRWILEWEILDGENHRIGLLHPA